MTRKEKLMLGISARLLAISAGATVGWNASSIVAGTDTSMWPFVFTGFGILFMGMGMMAFYLETIYNLGE